GRLAPPRRASLALSRRARIGPHVTLVFENRQTLWFRVQEVLRVARLGEPGRVRQELELYNRLLPGRDLLQAALLIEAADGAVPPEELAAWQGPQGDHPAPPPGRVSLPAG